MAFLRARRMVVAGLSALCVGACLSPTLPLPPPSKPVIEGPDSQGQVTLSGSVQMNATAFALNTRTGEGRFQVTGETGDFVIVLPVQSGDEIAHWYSLGTDDSPSIVFRVP